MKLSHYTIIFFILILPFSIIVRNNMKEYFLTLKDEVRLNNAIDVATMDALDTLIDMNDEFQMLYIDSRFDVNQTLAKEAVKTFFKTFAINYNMPYIPGSTENYFSVYVPAILVIGYDGFFVYSVDETDGGTFAYQMSPKIPYSYVDPDTGVIVNFTLGNYIRIFTNGRFYQGILTDNYTNDSLIRYSNEYLSAFNNNNDEALKALPELTEDMSIILAALYNKQYYNPSEKLIPSFLLSSSEKNDIPLLQDYQRGTLQNASKFHEKRREVIVKLIQDTLRQEINSHRTYATMMGSNYNFSLPEVNSDDWTNSINDISIMAFIQGMPIGTKSYYNNYALGASRIVQTNYFYGTNDSDGKIYHRYDCAYIKDAINGGTSPKEIKEVFLNRTQAAENGYWPCLECRP